MRPNRFVAELAVLLLLMLGCARNPADGATDTPSARAGDPDTTALREQVARLEAELRELAMASGCDTAAQCKTAPVGERACGGPRDYVIYCPVRTDEAALLAAADSLKQMEMRLNEATGAVSTCEMRLPPELAIEAGVCTAANR